MTREQLLELIAQREVELHELKTQLLALDNKAMADRIEKKRADLNAKKTAPPR